MRNKKIYTAYVPHGINSKYYYPITEGDSTYDEFNKFSEEFKERNGVDFVIFWNNRNIRRKQPGDVILSFRRFCDKIPKEKSKKVCLLMHTHPRDENGTDLIEVKNTICPDYKVIFSDKKVGVKELNFFYNISDVTLNIASNEGFGLSGAESLMTGTPIINNVTGGLQDHCRFEDENGKWIDFNETFTSNHSRTYEKCGVWAKPVFPTNRSLQGSLPTPYIFDDRCSFEDVSEALLYWYNMDKDTRIKYGMEGRAWALSGESGMSAKEMCGRFIKHINSLLDVWEPEEPFVVENLTEKKKDIKKHIGITW